jgi:glutamyl-tRNA reductase
MIVALSVGPRAPLELRERLALDETAMRDVFARARGLVDEMVLACTCHRTEIYATAGSGDDVHHLAALLPTLRPEDRDEVAVLHGVDAVQHLFRVACGLDSIVVGEPQVLGQVRRALRTAQAAGTAGPVLANVFGRAIGLGRRARLTTSLGAVGGSIGAVTAAHLDRVLGGVTGTRGTIVGAGEAAADVALALSRMGAELTIASRTIGSAERLASRACARAVALPGVSAALRDSAFAVVAVSGGVVLRADELPAGIVVIDLSVPRAVERAPCVYGLDAVDFARDPALEAAVAEAEALVADEVARIGAWIERRGTGAAIGALRARVERIVSQEVERAIAGEATVPPERVRLLASRIANKILHGPTVHLREGDDDTRELILRMFEATG